MKRQWAIVSLPVSLLLFGGMLRGVHAQSAHSIVPPSARDVYDLQELSSTSNSVAGEGASSALWSSEPSSHGPIASSSRTFASSSSEPASSESASSLFSDPSASSSSRSTPPVPPGSSAPDGSSSSSLPPAPAPVICDGAYPYSVEGRESSGESPGWIPGEIVSLPSAPLISWVRDFGVPLARVLVTPPRHQRPFVLGNEEDYCGTFGAGVLELKFWSEGVYNVEVVPENGTPVRYLVLAGTQDIPIPITLAQYRDRRSACDRNIEDEEEISFPNVDLWIISNWSRDPLDTVLDDTVKAAQDAVAKRWLGKYVVVKSVAEAVTAINVTHRELGHPIEVVFIGHGSASLIRLGDVGDRTRLPLEGKALIDNMNIPLFKRVRGKVASVKFIACCVAQRLSEPPRRGHLMQNLANILAPRYRRVSVSGWDKVVALSNRDEDKRRRGFPNWYFSVPKGSTNHTVSSNNVSPCELGEEFGRCIDGPCPPGERCVTEGANCGCWKACDDAQSCALGWCPPGKECVYPLQLPEGDPRRDANKCGCIKAEGEAKRERAIRSEMLRW